MYSVGALNLFNTVKSRINSGCPVALGAKKVFGSKDGLGPAGETKRLGMLGGHAYAILGVSEEL